jgi:xanthine dehydrogenase YagS FAD-binding subunit
MTPFTYERATDAAGAVALVTGRPGATYVAGGTNLVDHLRLGIVQPEALVDVSRLPLDHVRRADDGGLRIGATVRNSDLAAHPDLRRDYPVVAQALLAGASGQIRNAATTAGNLLQRTRCSYFQDVSTPCNKREPGSGCSAVSGFRRMHAILGASEHCIATHPSDFAVALACLDAEVVVLGAAGERRIPFGDLHRLPGDQPQRDTVLEPGELITEVVLPPLPIARSSTYRKVRERASYAFALVSVAAAIAVEDGIVRDVRVALGGVAHKPWRATVAEEALRGAEASEESFRAAASAELERADPLPDLAWKVPLARNTIVATLRGLVNGGAR